MAKRSTNFNCYKRVGHSAEDLVATLRALGLTDEEIRAAVSGPTPVASDAVSRPAGDGDSTDRGAGEHDG
jgi:hypothetical protein